MSGLSEVQLRLYRAVLERKTGMPCPGDGEICVSGRMAQGDAWVSWRIWYNVEHRHWYAEMRDSLDCLYVRKEPVLEDLRETVKEVAGGCLARCRSRSARLIAAEIASIPSIVTTEKLWMSYLDAVDRSTRAFEQIPVPSWHPDAENYDPAVLHFLEEEAARLTGLVVAYEREFDRRGITVKTIRSE